MGALNELPPLGLLYVLVVLLTGCHASKCCCVDGCTHACCTEGIVLNAVWRAV